MNVYELDGFLWITSNISVFRWDCTKKIISLPSLDLLNFLLAKGKNVDPRPP